MRARSVLVAADMWFGSTPYGIAQGLRRLGWDVHELNLGNWFPAWHSTPLRIARRAVAPLVVRDYNAAVRARLDQLRPAALLTVKGLHLQPDTLRQAAAFGALTANYYPDFHFDYAGLDLDTFACYDRFYTTKAYQVGWLAERLGADRVEYLPHGYSADVHRPPDPRPPFDCDVAYVGIRTAHKERWLTQLRRRLPGVRLRIWGNGWNSLLSESPLRDCHAGRAVLGAAYCRVLASARICLAIHAGPRVPGGWEDQVSTRTFEIPACRAFMLHVDTPEVRGLFEPETEIGVFDGLDDLCRQVERYVGDDARREAMIERAWRRCVPAYSYDARAAVIGRWIERSGGGHA